MKRSTGYASIATRRRRRPRRSCRTRGSSRTAGSRRLVLCTKRGETAGSTRYTPATRPTRSFSSGSCSSCSTAPSSCTTSTTCVPSSTCRGSVGTARSTSRCSGCWSARPTGVRTWSSRPTCPTRNTPRRSAGSDRNDIYVVRSGPKASLLTPVESRDGLKKGKKFLVCYLGVMAPQDGVDYLLRAIRHVVDVVKRKDIHFALIGSGDSFGAIKQLRDDLGLTDCVEMTGRITDDDVAGYLSTADLCVCPDPQQPPERRVHHEQGARVHDLREGDGLVRPEGEPLLRRPTAPSTPRRTTR